MRNRGQQGKTGTKQKPDEKYKGMACSRFTWLRGLEEISPEPTRDERGRQ